VWVVGRVGAVWEVGCEVGGGGGSVEEEVWWRGRGKRSAPPPRAPRPSLAVGWVGRCWGGGVVWWWEGWSGWGEVVLRAVNG